VSKLISWPGRKIDPTKSVSLQQPVDPLVSATGVGVIVVLGARSDLAIKLKDH
jgi:hypothetical protein